MPPGESVREPATRIPSPTQGGTSAAGDTDAAKRVRALGSIPWSGRSLARLVEVYSRIEARHEAHPSDWWIYGVPPLAFLHLLLFVMLHARPGRLGVVLWRWGPSALAVLSSALLFAALLSAVWNRRTWNGWRLAGYLGLSLLVGSLGFYRTYPSSHDRAPSRVRFRLPLDGPITVAWGGGSPDVNYHVAAPAQRWAYDLLITKDGRSRTWDGTRLTDYYAYGRPVLSPAEGRVFAVHDGEPDVPAGRTRRGNGAGNHVVLEIARGEYLFIAHLRPGSIIVGPGQQIAAGQTVGAVGNSGNTSEPHVHVHLQDTPVPDLGEGIPFYFSDYLARSTGKQVERGMPTGGVRRGTFIGEVVESVAPALP